MFALIGFLLAIAILILVHEWGHFILARLCGVPVLAFSLGFGPVLARHRDKRGCEWRLSAIPLGGYVKMLSLAEKPSLTEQYPSGHFDWDRAFERHDVKKRLAIVLAGPLMNILFAVLVYAAIAMSGVDAISTRVGTPVAGSQAAYEKVESGWVVRAVGDRTVRTYPELARALEASKELQRVSLQFANDRGATQWIDFSPVKGSDGKALSNQVKALGITPYIDHVLIGLVFADSAAEAAGLRSGDKLVSVDGKPAKDAHALIAKIRKSAGKTLVFQVVRSDASSATIPVVPRITTTEDGQRYARIGATLASIPETVFVREGPIDAFVTGTRQVFTFVQMTVGSLYRMAVGAESLKSLSGPVTIGAIAGETLKIGPMAFLSFLAVLSISIGVINLLPVPVLDGGHIAIFLWEFATGKKPGERASAILTKIGLLFILLLMAISLFNDFTGGFRLH